MAVSEILIDLWDRILGLDVSRNLVLKGGAFMSDAAGSVVNTTAAALTLTQAAHGNRSVVLGAATQTLTLPAATGSGIRYSIYSGVAATTQKVQVASASDYMRGQSWAVASANVGFQTANTGTVATESDTFTMNGTTQGGVVGSVVEFTDIAPNIWQVEGALCASGTGATPFSVAV